MKKTNTGTHNHTQIHQLKTMYCFFGNIFNLLIQIHTLGFSEICLHLCSVGQKDGRGQVASDATEHVDDGDSEPASQLLDVPQHGHLEQDRHQAVQDSAEDRQ